MNKLEGFYALKGMGIPTVPWLPFTGQETLDVNLLWTVRVAVQDGNDFNLPRAVGVTAEEAIRIGKEYINRFSTDDLVIYYPYFIALKSGVIDLQDNQTIIEAVDKDLWNLTTFGRQDETIIIDHLSGGISIFGDAAFLTDIEKIELRSYANKIRAFSRDYIFAGSSVMVEWSYAVNTNVKREIIGEQYLVFTECKVVGRRKLF